MKKLFVFALIVSLFACTAVAFAADDDDDTGSHGSYTPEKSAEQKEADKKAARAVIDSAASAIEEAAKNPSAATKKIAESFTSSDVPDAVTLPEDAKVVVASGNAIETLTGDEKEILADLASNYNKAAPIPAPKIKVPESVKPGDVVTVTLFDAKFKAATFANVEKLFFYPDVTISKTQTVTKSMWLSYVNAGETTKGYLTSSSTKADIQKVKDNATVFMNFIYATPAENGGYKVRLADTGDTFVPGIVGGAAEATEPEPAIGSSGGGCVAGTSTAALALAVLGFAMAKRKAA